MEHLVGTSWPNSQHTLNIFFVVFSTFCIDFSTYFLKDLCNFMQMQHLVHILYPFNTPHFNLNKFYQVQYKFIFHFLNTNNFEKVFSTLFNCSTLSGILSTILVHSEAIVGSCQYIVIHLVTLCISLVQFQSQNKNRITYIQYFFKERA